MLSAASRTRILLDDALRKRGISYDLAVETDSVEAIKQHVAGGTGISILPDIAISAGDAAELAIQPLPILLAEELAGVVTLRGRPLSQAAQNFIAELGQGGGQWRRLGVGPRGTPAHNPAVASATALDLHGDDVDVVILAVLD